MALWRQSTGKAKGTYGQKNPAYECVECGNALFMVIGDGDECESFVKYSAAGSIWKEPCMVDNVLYGENP